MTTNDILDNQTNSLPLPLDVRSSGGSAPDLALAMVRAPPLFFIQLCAYEFSWSKVGGMFQSE